MKKNEKWLIIDEKGKIIESTRNQNTATNLKVGLKKIYVGATLKIIHRKDYNTVIKKE